MADTRASQWAWDPSRKEYYYWDPVAECYIYHSGTRIYPGREPMPSPPKQPPPKLSSQRSNESYGSVESAFSAESSLSHDFRNLNVQDENQGQVATEEETKDLDPGAEPSFPNREYTYRMRLAPPNYLETSYGQSSTSCEGDATPRAASPAIPRSSRADQSTRYRSTAEEDITEQDPEGEVQEAEPPLARDLVSEPKEEITDPTLLRLNVQAHKKLRGTWTGDVEPLDPAFQVRRPGRAFFKLGKVFKVLWPELAGDTADGLTTFTTAQTFGEQVFAKIRWFVIVKEGDNCCSCLPIQTYGGRGVPANKRKDHHAIIYTGSRAPEPKQSEIPQHREEPMGSSIRVRAKARHDKLDSVSRVNFFKIYTVEHNVKVYDFGQVDRNDEWKLVAQFNAAWNIGGRHSRGQSSVQQTQYNPASGQQVQSGYPIALQPSRYNNPTTLAPPAGVSAPSATHTYSSSYPNAYQHPSAYSPYSNIPASSPYMTPTSSYTTRSSHATGHSQWPSAPSHSSYYQGNARENTEEGTEDAGEPEQDEETQGGDEAEEATYKMPRQDAAELRGSTDHTNARSHYSNSTTDHERSGRSSGRRRKRSHW